MNKSAYTIPGFIRFAYKNSKPEIQKKFLVTHIYILLTAIFDNAVSYSLIFIIQEINSSEIIKNDSIQNFIFLNKNIFLTLSLYLFFLIKRGEVGTIQTFSFGYSPFFILTLYYSIANWF